MEEAADYVNERLDHLGLVAGVCHEIGLAAWLDTQEPGNRQQVSVGAATVAMVLNGLGKSLRQLYLVPQFFANKPVEHLLGPGIRAEMLNDDCLGRTLDWLYAHDLTKLFAGIATHARQVFGITAQQVHVDTTSFSVSGEYVGTQVRRVYPKPSLFHKFGARSSSGSSYFFETLTFALTWLCAVTFIAG
jgi:transposase